MPETASLADSASDIIERLERANAVRDRALTEARLVVRLSANAIRATQRGELDRARSECARAADAMARIAADLAGHPGIYWAGYVQDAMKEVAEANVLLAIACGQALPTPTVLHLEDAPFLNGLAEAASELRRLTLDALRGDDLALPRRYLRAMDDIYDVLITIDFPDALTGGLRRTTDQLRAVLERTRGDVTVTLNQRRLEAAVRDAANRTDRPD